MGCLTPPAFADCTTAGNSLTCDNVLYYYNGSTPLSDFDSTTIVTTGSGSTSPLGGFGVYLHTNGMNAPKLNDITIKTTGSAADAIRTNSEAVYFKAKNLTIEATGSSADGINVASDFNNNYDSLVYVTESANISVKDGVAVRANNFQNQGANSIIVLAGSNVIKVTDTASASNTSDSKGYAVYAGNRNTDTNGIGFWDIIAGKNNNTLGNAYVFIGGNSEISTATKAGHAVYANKGGVIQLGDGADISTTGENAYAIYASTEQQGTYTDNVRPGHVYLAGGAKLRAANSVDVIRANGVDSIIASQSLSVPVISDSHQRTDRLDIDRTALTDSEGVFDIEGNINAINGGTIALNMSDASRFVGSSSVDGLSTINLNVKGGNSQWTMTKDSTLTNLTLNDARLTYQSSGAGEPFTPKTLTVEGNYAGNGGTLTLNTALGDDHSPTDMLVIRGNVEAGTTKVAIVNIGGAGDQTIEGIKIVDVGGTSIGSFIKQSRISVGGYDYDVVKGASNQNWYLTSQVAPTTPDPGSEGTGGGHKHSPEFGSYLANNYAANTMFLTRLHDRLGETQYTDALTGEQKVTSMWMRNVGGHTRFGDDSGQLKTRSNRYVVQLGGDLAQWSTDGLDRWHLGLMAGYGSSQSSTRSNVISERSHGQVSGYSAGLYGTWYGNEADKTGAYVDSWVLYNWFNNKVMGDGYAADEYKSHGITASIESGYSFKLGEKNLTRYWIQPKAQVVWVNVRAGDHNEHRHGFTYRIFDRTDGNLLIRLGVRAYMTKGHDDVDSGKDREFQPFIEANWIHNTQNQRVKMGTANDEMRGTKNIGEVKVGIEGLLGKRLNLWGNVAQQVGDKGYGDTSAMLGVKYAF